MQFFDKEFLKFFKQLRANNDRDWFNANKPRFIEHVKDPFDRFVTHMIEEMRKHDPQMLITAKDAVFRIYRDTRFSKDKTPYKDHIGAVLSRGGRKDMTSPGVYLQMNDVDFRIYSGVYMPDKNGLQNVREAIAQDLKGFQKLYNAKKFKDAFGEIRGEKNKRLPKEFVEIAEKEPYIFNKGFYYFAKLDPNVILENDLPKSIIKHWKIAAPLNEFFQKAINQKS